MAIARNNSGGKSEQFGSVAVVKRHTRCSPRIKNFYPDEEWGFGKTTGRLTIHTKF